MNSKHTIVYDYDLDIGEDSKFYTTSKDLAYGLQNPQAYILVEVDYVTGTGTPIFNVHNPKQCEGEGCAIHHPSDHLMVDFPTHWRPKTAPFEIGHPLMERICPHHIGHPDPDHLAWVERVRGVKSARADSVHGCDGCCTDDGPPVDE